MKDDGEEKILRRASAGRRGTDLGDALAGLRSTHQPVHARGGKWRIDSGAVKFDAIDGMDARVGSRKNHHGLFDTLGVKLQEVRIKAGIKPSGDELRHREVVPAFAGHADFQGGKQIQRDRVLARGENR